MLSKYSTFDAKNKGFCEFLMRLFMVIMCFCVVIAENIGWHDFGRKWQILLKCKT